MSIWGNPAGASLAHLLPLSGGTMTGDIDMNQNRVKGLPLPAAADQAANKGYVDSAVKPLGSKAEKQVFSLSLPAANWVGTEAPYTQTVPLAGILETDCPHYGVVYSADGNTRLGEKESFALVDDLETAAGSVTLTCLEGKPEADLTLQLEVIR